MEGEEIGLVLARASELRSKVMLCIDGSGGDRSGEAGDEGGRTATSDDEDEEEKEEAESLVGIRDALDSLERQLGALQVIILNTKFCHLFSIKDFGDCCAMILITLAGEIISSRHCRLVDVDGKRMVATREFEFWHIKCVHKIFTLYI